LTDSELFFHSQPNQPKNVKKGRFAMSFSLVPLLIAGKSISPEARQALRENRLQDAAKVLMHEYGLSCVEASQLLDVSACEDL